MRCEYKARSQSPRSLVLIPYSSRMAHRLRDSRSPPTGDELNSSKPDKKRQKSNLQPTPIDRRAQSVQYQRTVSHSPAPSSHYESQQLFQSPQYSDDSRRSANPHQPAFQTGQYPRQTFSPQGYGYINASQQSLDSPQQITQYLQSIGANQGPFGGASQCGQPSNSSGPLSQVGYALASGFSYGLSASSPYNTSTMPPPDQPQPFQSKLPSSGMSNEGPTPANYSTSTQRLKQSPYHSTQDIPNAASMAQSQQERPTPKSAQSRGRSVASTYPSNVPTTQRSSIMRSAELTAEEWLDLIQQNRLASKAVVQGYFCVPCGYHFHEYTDLTYHENQAHGRPTYISRPDGFKCQKCADTIYTYGFFERHLKTCFLAKSFIFGK